LEGTTIGISAGNSHEIIFPAFAETAEFDDSGVEWLTMDAGAMGPALIQGQIDVAPVLAVHEARLNKVAEARGGGVSRISVADYGLELSALSFVTMESKLEDEQYVSDTSAFLQATARAAEYLYIDGNIQEGADAVFDRNPELDETTVLGAAET